MSLAGCGHRSSGADGREHRSVFVQMLALRENVMEYQNSSGKSPSSVDDLAGSGQPWPVCHMLDGRRMDWRFNPSATANADWLLAAPIATEHDGLKGVWVLTKGMTIQVASANKVSPIADDPSKNTP